MSFKSPKAMHIATHGYFKETPKNQTDNFANNPLLNSGLMLTGSGTILDNKENTYVNNTPGILTAYEVVNMNLDNTEIVVLSACETGKGQVEAGEGVYGLQRSFLIAGANCVIISLFKVNDEVTKSLMIEFYKNWLKSGDKRAAFNQAKRTIKAKYEDFPIFWGAFIMIEGKAPRKYIN
jgi:CHAT domain-containing protein